MVRFRYTLCACLLMMLTGMAVAQNNTNSPYTRYGLGDLSDQFFGNSRAMGGIAIGLRDNSQINPVNPASYTAIDTLTFIFEGGLSLQNMNLSGGGVKQNAKNSSFDYLAMQFRLRPWMAMSLGLLPYSNVGYSLSDTRTSEEGLQYSRTFSGDGGTHQLYAGLGFKLLKNFSVGANVSYFWGDITRSRLMIYPQTSDAYSYLQTTQLSINDYKLDFGAQYTQPLNKKSSLTIGAVYSPKHNLNNNYTIETSAGYTGIQELNADLSLPSSFGVGVSYNYDKRLTVGLDYSLQRWSDVNASLETDDADLREGFDQTFAYGDRSRISLGAEYIPNLMGRTYFAHIKYRLGAYYSTPYYKINGKKAANEYGITAGFGFPMLHSRSILSLTGQFVRLNGKQAGMLNENVFRICIGITFCERWFSTFKVE